MCENTLMLSDELSYVGPDKKGTEKTEAFPIAENVYAGRLGIIRMYETCRYNSLKHKIARRTKHNKKKLNHVYLPQS